MTIFTVILGFWVLKLEPNRKRNATFEIDIQNYLLP